VFHHLLFVEDVTTEQSISILFKKLKWIWINAKTLTINSPVTMNSLPLSPSQTLVSEEASLPLLKPMSASLKRYYNNREEILEKNRLKREAMSEEEQLTKKQYLSEYYQRTTKPKKEFEAFIGTLKVSCVVCRKVVSQSYLNGAHKKTVFHLKHC
jgi:hypothetical protein